MNSDKLNKNIILFPGCFDPIHLQHQKIIETIAKRSDVDEVWILLNQDSEEKQIIASFEQRFSLIKKIFPNHNKIKIWSKPIGFYTELVIEKIQNEFTDKNFKIILGTDQINNLPNWEKVRNLGKTIPIIGIVRKNYPLDQTLIKKYHITMIKNIEINNFNSSEIKAGLNWKNLNLIIKKSLQTNTIYYKNILNTHINKPDRIKHSITVAELAQKIAEKFNLTTLKFPAYFVGYFHDLAKNWNKQKIENFYLKHKLNPSYLWKMPEAIWHGHVAADFLKLEMQIKDQSLLQAIKYHTTCHIDFNSLDKILFIADKLEISKMNAPWYQKSWKILIKNDYQLEDLFISVLNEMREKFKIKKIIPTEETTKAWNKFLLKKIN